MPDAVRAKMRDLVLEHGQTIIQSPERCCALIADELAGYPLETSLLKTALQDGIPLELLDTQVPTPIQVERLAKRLQKQRGLEASSARNAVQIWAYALALDMAGSAKQNDDGAPVGQSLGHQNQPSAQDRFSSLEYLKFGCNLFLVISIICFDIGVQFVSERSHVLQVLLSSSGLIIIWGLYTERYKAFAMFILISEPIYLIYQILGAGHHYGPMALCYVSDVATIYMGWRLIGFRPRTLAPAT